MANPEHLSVLAQGVDNWNRWREQHPDIYPDLSDADLFEADLGNANFQKTNLVGADLNEAYLGGAEFRGAKLDGVQLNGAKLMGVDLQEMEIYGLQCMWANFSEADLSGTYLDGANFCWANLSRADLSYSNLSDADFSNANLRGANLRMADLTGARFVQSDLSSAILTDCRIFGISVWEVILDETEQKDLIITPYREPLITVDNLEVAQFIYLLLKNQRIRNVIDAITSKVVLILGRFTPHRKAILDAIREELRQHNYLPVLFDFEKSHSRDLTETVTLLAHMARFIIADLTEPSSIPQELQAIVPHVAVPVQPLLAEGRPYSMFQDYRKYHWMLKVHRYKGLKELMLSLPEKVIAPAEAKAKALVKIKDVSTE